MQDDEDVKRMLQGSSMVKVIGKKNVYGLRMLLKTNTMDKSSFFSAAFQVRSPRWQKRRTLKLMEDGVTVWCQSQKTSSRAKEQQSCKYVYVCAQPCVYKNQS